MNNFEGQNYESTNNQSWDENPRECMLPISFIPMDAINHLYELLSYVMKEYPQYSLPDRKHVHSLTKYFRNKKFLSQGKSRYDS